MAAVRALAAGDGRSEDEVVEESIRRYFGLRGIAVLDTLAEQQAESGEELDEEAAMRWLSRSCGLFGPDAPPGDVCASLSIQTSSFRPPSARRGRLAGSFDSVSPDTLRSSRVRCCSRKLGRRCCDRSSVAGSVGMAIELLTSLEGAADLVDDPSDVIAVVRDPGDDYLVALAREASADAIVTGDLDLLALPRSTVTVLAPRDLPVQRSHRWSGAEVTLKRVESVRRG